MTQYLELDLRGFDPVMLRANKNINPNLKNRIFFVKLYVFKIKKVIQYPDLYRFKNLVWRPLTVIK